MSMYNMLHGKNTSSALLLFVLNIDQENGKWHSGRFRDIYPDETGANIILYTRNGGGNREHYADDTEAGPDCGCTGCAIEHHLCHHPNYLSDADDDYDCTYAYVTFSVPPEYAEIVKGLATGERPETIHEKFEKSLAEMKAMTPEQVKADPRFKPLAQILEQITEDLK